MRRPHPLSWSTGSPIQQSHSCHIRSVMHSGVTVSCCGRGGGARNNMDLNEKSHRPRAAHLWVLSEARHKDRSGISKNRPSLCPGRAINEQRQAAVQLQQQRASKQTTRISMGLYSQTPTNFQNFPTYGQSPQSVHIENRCLGTNNALITMVDAIQK